MTLKDYIEAGWHAATPRELFGRRSSLGEGVPMNDGGYREAVAEDIFGDGSVLGVSDSVDAATATLMEMPVYQLLVVATLLLYLYMLLHSWRFIGGIWGGIFTSQSEQRMAFEGGELPLARFKQVAASIGLVLISLVVVRLLDGMVSLESISVGWSLVVHLAALAVALLFFAWFYLLHIVVAWVANFGAMGSLAASGYMNFVRTVVIVYPFAAVWLVADIAKFAVASNLLIITTILLVILYLKDTFLFFVGKKISIFYWILYLCTAILLPLSFLLRVLCERIVV